MLDSNATWEAVTKQCKLSSFPYGFAIQFLDNDGAHQQHAAINANLTVIIHSISLFRLDYPAFGLRRTQLVVAASLLINCLIVANGFILPL